MAKDFKASQIRTSKIIISGSEPGKPALLIYSASSATDHAGSFQSDMLTNVGSDVYLFVSGNNGSVLSGNRSNVTLFGGDVVVSGTFYAEKLVAEVDTSTPSDHYVSGALYLAEKSAEPDVDGDQIVLYAADDGGVSKLYFKNSDGATEIGGGGGSVTSGSFNEVANINAAPTTFVTTSSLSMAGESGISYGVDNVGSDVFFFVSGTLLQSGYGLKSTSLIHSRSVFGGDLVVSGNIHGERSIVGWDNIVLNRKDYTTGILGGLGRSPDNNDIVLFSSRSTNAGSLRIQGYRSAGGSTSFDYVKFAGDGDYTFGGAKTINFLPRDGGEDGSEASKPRMTFLSGGAASSPDEIAAADVAIFFSGSSNSLDEATRGSTLFGGDVATSGTLKITRDVAHSNQIALMLNQGATDAGSAGSISQTFVAGFSGFNTGDGSELSIQKYGPNNTAQLGGPFANFIQAKSGSLILAVGGTTGEYEGKQAVVLSDVHQSNFLIATGSKSYGTRRVLFMSGGAASSPDEQSGTDVNFFVSGTAGSKDSTVRGTSIFGGDVVISGTLYDGSGNSIASGGSISSVSGSTTIATVSSIDFTEAGILNDNGSGVAALTGTIGNPEDGSYADGLFTTFTPQTTIGVAIDKINEVLKYLAPSPAPGLDNIDADGAQGDTAYLSFGATMSAGSYVNVDSIDADNSLTAVDITEQYTVTTGSGGDLRLGIYSAGTTVAGDLNSDVAASDYNSGAIINHPEFSFGDADQGELQLWVNNTQVTFDAKSGSPNSVDLEDVGTGAGDPGSGTDSTFVNSNGTGFIQLSTTGSARTQSDIEFPLFKHRTGRFTIAASDQRDGYNYAAVKHVIGSTTKITNFVEWVYDSLGPASAIDAQNYQIYLNSLDGGTNRYDLSGVRYAVTSSGEYRVRVDNYYKYVYGTETITNNITNASIGSTTPSSVEHIGPGEDYTKSIHVTSSFATTTATMLGDSLVAKISSLSHPTKTGLTNAGSVTSNLFLIYSGSVSNNNNEYFEHEGFRLQSGSFVNQSDVTGGTYDWDSSTHMTASNGGHSDGLQYYNGSLASPTNTLNGGDFKSNTDTGTYFGQDPDGVDYVYSGQPDYSGETGLRTFYRKIQNDSGAAASSFKIVMSQGTGDLPSIVAPGTSLGTNNMRVFARLPGEAGSGWLNLYDAFTFGDTSDRAGGRASSLDNATSAKTNYFTFGTGSLAAGDYFVLKIEADASLAREIGSMTFDVPGFSSTHLEANDLETLNSESDGVEAKVSFGSTVPLTGFSSVGTAGGESAVDINGTFPVSGIRYGVIDGSTAITGTLNFDKTANGYNYPDDAFGKADALTLSLIINGSFHNSALINNLSLSGDVKTSDSGFINLSQAQNPKDSSNNIPDYTKWYRTGQVAIGPSDMRPGWNYAYVSHNDGTTVYSTNYIEWVVDNDSSGLSITNTEFGTFGESNSQGVYYQSGVKYFQDPTGSFKSQADHAYSSVYSPLSNAITITSVSNLNNASFIQVTGSSTVLTDAASNQMALPSLDTSLSEPTTGSLFITGTLEFSQGTSLPGSSPFAGTAYAAAAKIDVKHPLDGNQTSGDVYVGGNSSKKFLVFSASLGSTNAYTTERFAREDYRIVSGNYTAQSDTISGKWDSTKDMNDSGNTNYYNGMLVYNGKLGSPSDSRLPGAGDFRSYFDVGSSDLISPLSNVNYSSLPALSSSHRYYYRTFENNTVNNVFNVDVVLYGDANLVGRAGALSGSLGANDNIYVEGKIPGKTGWLDLGRATAGSGNISDGDGGLNGDVDQVVDGSGATNNLTFNGQTVNGTGTGAEKIVLKITAHKDWTGYLSQIDISY